MTSPTARTRPTAIDFFGRKRSGATLLSSGLTFGDKVVADIVYDPASFLEQEQLRPGLRDMATFCGVETYSNYTETSRGLRPRLGPEMVKDSEFDLGAGRVCGAGLSNLGKVGYDQFHGKPTAELIKGIGESIGLSGGYALMLGGVGRAVDREDFQKWWQAACAALTDDNSHWTGTELEYLAGLLIRSTFGLDERHWAPLGEVVVDGVTWDGTKVVLDVEGQRIMLAPRSTGRLLGRAVTRTGSVQGKFPAQERVPTFSEMRVRGLGVVCDRLEYLYELQADDPDEPPILFDSLKSLKQFMLANPQLATDRLGVDSTGCLTATWILRREVDKGSVKDDDLVSGSFGYWGNGDGILVMVFQPTGSVRFAANSGPPVNGFDRLRCNGVLPAESVLTAVSEFTQWLMLG